MVLYILYLSLNSPFGIMSPKMRKVKTYTTSSTGNSRTKTRKGQKLPSRLSGTLATPSTGFTSGYENNTPDTLSSSSSSTTVLKDSGGPWLVNILLGDPHYQYYVIHSLVQIRLLNPSLRMILVISPAFYIQKPEWVNFLQDALQVNLVNYTMLQSDSLLAFADAYRSLWRILKGKVGFMLPTVKDKMNFEFTQYTMERLYALYSVMHVYGLENVLHLENDQMIYQRVLPIIEAVNHCDLTLVMTRMNREMAPAVVYARNATAIKDMLDFMYEAITNGVDHAIAVAGNGWVTDMTLTSAYFNLQYKLAKETPQNKKAQSIVSFPYEKDSSCLSNALNGLVFDAAPLGHWCCGTFERPTQYFTHHNKDSIINYWDFPFLWVNRTYTIQSFTDPSPHDALITVPEWNNLPLFNLHIHSKQLHLWKSLPYPSVPSPFSPNIFTPPPDKVVNG